MWLEILSEGGISAGVSSSTISVTWLRRCPAERREPDRGTREGARTNPRAVPAATNVGPLAAEKEASLVIGHEKAMSGA